MRNPLTRAPILAAFVIVMTTLAADVTMAGARPTTSAGQVLLGNVAFSGHVRRSGAATGVAGARLRLWILAGEYYPSWTLIREVVTGTTGSFSLLVAIAYNPNLEIPASWHFRVEKANPAGYVSVSALPGACNLYCLEPSHAESVDSVRYRLADMNGSYPNNTFFVSPAPPEVVSIMPFDGRSQAGYSQSFTVKARDRGGAGDIQKLDLEIDEGCGPPHVSSVQISLRPQSKLVVLTNDDGLTAIEGALPGAGQWGSGTLENSQCAIRLNKTRFSRSGDELTFEVGIRFKASYAGTYRLCAEARDSHDLVSEGDFGAWRVDPIATKTSTPAATATRTHTSTATLAATPTGAITASPSATATMPTTSCVHLPVLLKLG